MPSKSAAQAKLMRAVAHNPSFAKKVGVPQSVGQEFMKADKRKAKKYALGGPTSYSGEDTDDGMKMSTRRGGFKKQAEMSDEERYGKIGAEIRRLDPEAFKNRTDKSAAGNMKLLKELREKKSAPAAPAAAKPAAAPAAPKVEAPSVSGPRSGGRGSKPGMARVGSGRYDDPTSSFGERVMSPLSKLGDIFGRRAEERVMKDMNVDRAEARKRLDAKEAASGMNRGGGVKKYRGGGMPDLTGDGKVTRADVLKGRGVFNRGGGIKKYAGGGSVSSASKRADGIASRGKTRCKIV